MRYAVIITCLLACLPLVRAREEKVYRLYTKSDLVDIASVHVSKLPKKQQKYTRYIDLAAVPPKDRVRALAVLGYVFNSLSRSDLITLPQFVPDTEGALVYVDLYAYKIDPAAMDRLGELGSGPAPFPEPYFHAISEVVTEDKEEAYTVKVQRKDNYGRGYVTWNGREYVPVYDEVTKYRKVKGHKKKVVALAPWLNKATAAGLALLTESDQPIYSYEWFLANALTEPRYHELLGLDDTEASAKKLAAVDEKTADRVGAQTRGAVLFSEVAHHNRILERTPTLHRYGRGSYHSSLDFLTSIKGKDVLKNLLNSKPDAREIIFSLPNGLQAFFVVDGNGKRLDKADGDVAANRRSRFRDTQVRVAYHCIACHLQDKGWIEVDDEVRQLASKPITLLADAVSKDDERRGERIRQKFLGIDFNELLQADQAVVEVAVRAATKAAGGKGLSCAEVAKHVTDTIYSYNEEPVALQRLALELGAPQEDVLKVCQQEGVDPVLVVLRAGRKSRRDQIEAGGFAQVATLLYLKGKASD